MKIRTTSGKERELEEVIRMQDDPKRRFWLLAAIAQISGEDASLAAQELSCEEIIYKYNFGRFLGAD